MLVAERRNPAESFAGLSWESLWDEFQVAYFAGEASWNYFVTPFLLARPDFAVEEAEPWPEDGQVWHTLAVTYPDTVIAHTRRHTYYFDDTGLLRRLDYSVDILGAVPVVHYPSDYEEFDGIMVPTRRRVHLCNPDGSPQRDVVAVAIDVTDVTFD
jgi:hypothetical protein